MPVFPGLPDPSFRPIAKVEEDGYAMSEYHLLNHIGTHVDAPSHQIAGGDTLDEIGLCWPREVAPADVHLVAAGKDERDRLTLDRGGLGIALVRDGAEQFGGQPEGIEGHGEK